MKTSKQVEDILKMDKSTRNSDMLLYIAYLGRNGIHLSLQQKSAMMNLSSPETVGRIRRKLQEDGKYLPDEAVDEARFNKFKEVKNNTHSLQAIEVALDY